MIRHMLDLAHDRAGHTGNGTIERGHVHAGSQFCVLSLGARHP
jgi:hypothetical protein